MGIGNRPATGIALNVANMNSPEAYSVANALRAAHIEFEADRNNERWNSGRNVSLHKDQ